MNYILHLNKTFEKFCGDERLTPFHVSLYFSLFQYWNMARFRSPISISRDELMRSSKIGSVNTYIRCIKELDKWQYIKYVPSYNPQKGSQVYLYNFNNSNNNGSDISTDKSNNKTAKKANGKAGEKPVIPSINNTNKLNNTNSLNGNKPTIKKIITKNSTANENTGKQKKSDQPKEKKVAQKKRKSNHSTSAGISQKESKKSSEKASIKTQHNSEKRFRRPLLQTVQKYFEKNKWPVIEGEKLFNHYESNGWLVGGKTPMRNWQAAARNWILNAEKFSNGKTKTGRAGKLHTTTAKDYNEPL